MSDEKIGKFVNRINDIKSKNFPILGICLGSQILCNIGYEGGKINGLGFIIVSSLILDPLPPAKITSFIFFFMLLY